MPTDSLDDLAEARRKIEATRAALQTALDGQEAPEAIRQALEQLERLEGEMSRIETVVIGQTVGQSETA